jgi:hypothetical protein
MYSPSCFSARLRRFAQDQVPYSKEALNEDLLRVRGAWNECQESRDRDAIYKYLTGVFELVSWWAAEGRDMDRASWALRLQNIDPSDREEPFAAVIRCTADPADKRSRSKWSRILRYAAVYKPLSEPLGQFIQRKGGINKCASRFAQLGRRQGTVLSI